MNCKIVIQQSVVNIDLPKSKEEGHFLPWVSWNMDILASNVATPETKFPATREKWKGTLRLDLGAKVFAVRADAFSAIITDFRRFSSTLVLETNIQLTATTVSLSQRESTILTLFATLQTFIRRVSKTGAPGIWPGFARGFCKQRATSMENETVRRRGAGKRIKELSRRTARKG